MANTRDVERLKQKYYYRMWDLKNSSMIWGIIGMSSVWVALLIHMIGTVSGRIELQNNPEKYDISPGVPKYFDKFHLWIAVVAAVLITLVGIFALLVKQCLPMVKQPKFDAYAHLCAALILGVAALFIAVYMTNVYQATCGEKGYVTRKNREIDMMNNNKTEKNAAKWSQFSCLGAVLVFSTSLPAHYSYSTVFDNYPGSVGFFAILFVFAAVGVLTQGVICFWISVSASNHMTVLGALKSSPTGEKADDDALSTASLLTIDCGRRFK